MSTLMNGQHDLDGHETVLIDGRDVRAGDQLVDTATGWRAVVIAVNAPEPGWVTCRYRSARWQVRAGDLTGFFTVA